jgi:Fe(3+) dicitrate transport protein
MLLTLGVLAVPVGAFAQSVPPRDSTKVRAATTPQTIGGVTVRATPPAGSVRAAPEVNGAWVLAGVKSEVLQVRGMDANLTEKTGRQLFAKIPGVFVYDMDGSGNQINISTRGLDAHRSWELNARQDGVVINSDLFGYPASHYSPPMESIERVELVRGTAALQYGSQFGGMVNYITKSGDTTRAMSVESNNTLGAFGLRSTYNAVGGRVGKLDYYAYLNLRRADGYRDAAESEGDAQFARVIWRASPTLTLRGQVGRSTYRYRIPGPLTDAQFDANPRLATRTRNYYGPDIVVPSLSAEWTPTPHTRVLSQLSGVFGARNSVQFIGFATARDTVNRLTGTFAPRQVDIDDFASLTGEVRLVHDWTINGRSHPLAMGLALSDNDTRRRQLGRGTTASNWDLDLPRKSGRVRDKDYAASCNCASYSAGLT